MSAPRDPMALVVKGWEAHAAEDCSGDCDGHRLLEARATIDELVKHAATLQHPSRLVRAATESHITLVLALGVEEATGNFKLLIERPFLTQLAVTDAHQAVEKRRQIITAIADALAKQIADETPNAPQDEAA